jgi:hypothetical protein
MLGRPIDKTDKNDDADQTTFAENERSPEAGDLKIFYQFKAPSPKGWGQCTAGFWGDDPQSPNYDTIPLCAASSDRQVWRCHSRRAKDGSDGTASSAICWKGVRAQLRSTALNAF